MTKKKKLIIVAFAVVVAAALVFAGVYNFRKQESESDVPKGAIPAQTDTARVQQIVTKVNAKGAASLIDKTVVYPQTQGQIKQLFVKVGDVVAEGDALVEYDDKSLKALEDQLDEARLSLKAARLALSATRLPATETELITSESQIAQAEKAVSDARLQVEQEDLNIEQIEDNLSIKRTTYDNAVKMYEAGVVSRTETDQAFDAVRQLENQLEAANARRTAALSSMSAAQTSVEYARRLYDITSNKQSEPASMANTQQYQIQVEQAELRIEQLEKDIADFVPLETSPVSGTVLSLNAVEGGVSVQSAPLMEVGDVSLDNLVIKVNVPENRMSGIALGQDAEIRGDALGRGVYAGRVTKIYPQAEQKQIGSTVETVIVVEVSPVDAAAPIKPGFTLETDIITKVAPNAVVVPLMALTSDDDGNDIVYIVRDDYSVEKRAVVVGTVSGMDAEVEGVSDGEAVVVNPSAQIKDGVFVDPGNPKEGGAEE